MSGYILSGKRSKVCFKNIKQLACEIFNHSIFSLYNRLSQHEHYKNKESKLLTNFSTENLSDCQPLCGSF